MQVMRVAGFSSMRGRVFAGVCAGLGPCSVVAECRRVQCAALLGAALVGKLQGLLAGLPGSCRLIQSLPKP